MGTDGRPGLEAHEVESRIMEFIRRELLSPEVTINLDDDLLSGDLFDSLGVLRLAAFVAEEFQFNLQPADFVIENFQTVAVLTQYVRRTTGCADRPPADLAR